MKKPIVTSAFSTTVKMNLKSMPTQTDSSDVSGFGLWFLADRPKFPDKFGHLFGFNVQWNGVGIFVFHEGSSG